MPRNWISVLPLAALIFGGCKVSVLHSESTAHLPPIAAKRAKVTVIHGDRLVDPYYWLRHRDDPRVMKYLNAENNYADWMMKPTEAFQEGLYAEMLSRIEESDATVPYREGEYLYYSKTQEGSQYSVYCRKKHSLDAPEEVVLDLNEMAKDEDFLDLGVYAVSDDGNLLAYSVDVTGFREYTLFILDLRSRKLTRERIPRVDSVTWAADNQTLFYVTEDKAKRPHRLFRHKVGSARSELLYEERDERFRLEVSRSRSKGYVFASSGSATADEVRYLDATRPNGAFQIVAPREPNHEYAVDHRGGDFYILTNDRGQNFRVVTAPVADPRKENWVELVPHREEVMITGLELFRDYYVLLEREDGLTQIRVTEIASGQSRHVSFPEPTYSLEVAENREFDAKRFRYHYESFTTPPSVFDCDMASGERTLLKEESVKNGYDRTQYRCERRFATAVDGTRIPISIVYRDGIEMDGSQPLWLYGYGAYGVPTDTWFSSNRLSLLDRGVIYAIAHARGGGEFGKLWHESGRMMNKQNTFADFIAAAEFLIAQGYTTKDRIIAEGASAGGLLMGAVLNLRPDLFRAALVDVPFVDILNTMLDPSLPLTVTEFEEWGNPRNKEQFSYMKAYSPYDNIAPKDYPAMLMVTSLNDSQVMYWEPAKYVAKLRATKTDSNPLLFKINMTGGHSGQSGRYDALRDIAFQYAFALRQLGIAE